MHRIFYLVTYYAQFLKSLGTPGIEHQSKETKTFFRLTSFSLALLVFILLVTNQTCICLNYYTGYKHYKCVCVLPHRI